MWKRTLFLLLVTLFWTGTAHAQALFDITNPGDPVQGVPDNGVDGTNGWPGNEAPPLAGHRSRGLPSGCRRRGVRRPTGS